VLPRHKTQPRRHVAPVLELTRISDSGDHRGRSHRSNAPYAGYPTAGHILTEELVDAPIELADANVDLVHESEKTSEDLAAELGEVVGLVGNDFRKHSARPPDRLGKADATVEQDAPHLADECGAVVH
jgi:hypothetical protein